jgi:hypothetical protein
MSSGLPVWTTASRIGSLGHHLLGAGDEIGREVAPVGLHPLDDVGGPSLGGIGLLDRDHPLVADPLHCLGDHLANRPVAIGRDRADLGDLVGGLHLPGVAFDVFDDAATVMSMSALSRAAQRVQAVFFLDVVPEIVEGPLPAVAECRFRRLPPRPRS